MKYYQKLVIDRLIGIPLVIFTNVVARCLGFILRRNHSLEIPPKKIVICKLVGMGSIIQSTTLIINLKKQFPDAKIIYFSSETNRAILKTIPLIDSIVTINDKSFSPLLRSLIKAVGQIWKFKPDTFLDLELYSNLSSILSSLSLARNRIGYYRKDQTIRLGIYTHMLFFNSNAPIRESYLQMGRILGCTATTSELYPIRIDEKTEATALQKFSDKYQITPQQYIVINPNASDLRIERKWPAEKFVALINLLALQMPVKIVLIGSGAEREYAQFIAAAVKKDFADKVINSAGELTIPELICMIRNASIIITNDTGPMHMAFALKKKTVSLFGPCNPQQYGNAANNISIYKEVYCSPCVHEFAIPPCYGDNQCMKRISVEEVLSSAIKLMGTGDFITEENNPLYYMKRDTNIPLGIITRKKWVM
jgi:ADP-heptose:LPS heptosyltransferase